MGNLSVQKMDISQYITLDGVKKQIYEIVGKNAGSFVSSVVSAVQANPALAECTNKSIFSAALLGESLKLSPSPQLGHYYMIPYDNKKTGNVEAQFQMGYKGYIQLAIRSGQYKHINVMAIKEGELKYFDPLNEEIRVELMIDDWDKREAAPTIGYYAMFELVNGFKKCIYWSKKQMLAHADKYSQAFSKDSRKKKIKNEWKTLVSFEDFEAGKYDEKDAWLYSSSWYEDFDAMAYKTMLRQLISKWGIMSIEMTQAFNADMAVIRDSGNDYVDNKPDNVVEVEELPNPFDKAVESEQQTLP